ncbi:epoxyqueuosine reductase QueH [bacterium]|nr:epoxyqueuosine reductase QueH [bacterium]
MNQKDLKDKVILVHICCAPCAVGILPFLKEQGFSIIGFFYNPNIHGEKEYQKRLKDVRRLCQKENIKLEIPDYNMQEYFSAIYDYEKKHYCKIEDNSTKRCPVCYRLRLETTAKYAQKIKADFFTTTLLISPYQQQSVIWRIGIELGEHFHIPFYFRDLRKIYWEALHKAKKRGFYLPTYCGCAYSLKEKEKGKL